MPNINTIPIPTFTGIEPYHFLFDNLPISAIASREEMISDATDLNTEILNFSAGSRIDLAARLNQSLTANGNLITSEVDNALHNIGHHTDGSYNGVDYVRMELSERQKLSLIQGEANYLSFEVETISNAVFFPSGILKLNNSDSLEWIVTGPNNITAELKFPKESAHRHYYGVTPSSKYLIPDYTNFTTGLSKPIVEGSLRVQINGVQIYSDTSNYRPSYDPNNFSTWVSNSFTVENDLIGFYLDMPLSPYDKIKIDFDVYLI
jgi:hypothetical protein